MFKKILEDIGYYFWCIHCNIKSFRNGIRNIFYYLPIIWEDRYYDFTFILILLKHKLERDAQYFKKNNVVEDAQQIYEQINEVIEYIDKYLNPEDAFVCERPDLADRFGDFSIGSTEFNEHAKYWTEEKDKFQEENWRKVWECICSNGQSWWD